MCCLLRSMSAYPSRLGSGGLLGMAADLWSGLGEPTHQQPYPTSTSAHQVRGVRPRRARRRNDDKPQEGPLDQGGREPPSSSTLRPTAARRTATTLARTSGRRLRSPLAAVGKSMMRPSPSPAAPCPRCRAHSEPPPPTRVRPPLAARRQRIKPPERDDRRGGSSVSKAQHKGMGRGMHRTAAGSEAPPPQPRFCSPCRINLQSPPAEGMGVRRASLALPPPKTLRTPSIHKGPPPPPPPQTRRFLRTLPTRHVLGQLGACFGRLARVGERVRNQRLQRYHHRVQLLLS